jgi:hypothetical protein
MTPDHDCVPGLKRAVTVSEYANLKGLREADVLVAIGQLKIPGAYFRGQWFIESPSNCEARLAQLRVKQRSPDSGDYAMRKDVHQESDEEFWARIEREAEPEPQRVAETRSYRLSEPPRAAGIDQHVHLDSAPQHLSNQESLPTSDTQETRRPQPVDYGLTYDDLNLYSTSESRYAWSCRLDDGKVIRCLGTRNDDRFKKGWRWFRVLHPLYGCADKAGGFAFLLLFIGGVATANKAWPFGPIAIGVGFACLLPAIIPGMIITRLRKRASPALKKYWQALHAYDDSKVAAEQAARQAARDAELRKRSYWTFLDGYAFERATAEVLNKHQFNAVVTPGSGDGGVDIVVTRNGLKGVVQCKAHMARIGPHVVRDLYGGIHHRGASFGIIVSLGGFSRGAAEFARDKPILFLDTDDLIAMQEGRDVLAEAFTRTDT